MSLTTNPTTKGKPYGPPHPNSNGSQAPAINNTDNVFTHVPTDDLRRTIELALEQLGAADALAIAPSVENYNDRARQKRLAQKNLESSRLATDTARQQYRAAGGNPLPVVLFVLATALSFFLEFLQSRYLASLLFREWGDDVLDIAGWGFAAGLIVVAHHFARAVRAVTDSRGGFPTIAMGRRGSIAMTFLILYLLVSAALIEVTGESFSRFVGGAAVLLIAVAVQFAAPTRGWVDWRTEWARRPWLTFRHWWLRHLVDRRFERMTFQLAEISQPSAGDHR